MRRSGRAEWWNEMDPDIRVGWRSLRSNPGYAATAIITAALGIGVTATIVSAAHAILVRPLPYPDADHLVTVYSENTVRGYHRTNISWPDFVSWRDENRA